MNPVVDPPNRTVVSRRNGALALRILAVLLFAAFWFGNLEFRDLADPDEGRYAEIPREMAVSGDWITPRLNDLKYFEKPPLQYWITAALYRAFGVDEWVARLGPALAGLAGALLVFAAGARLYDRRTGTVAAVMLLGTMAYVLFAHIVTLDMSVTLFLSATILGFAVAQRDGASPSERRRWMLFAWAAAAGAVLTKGLIGLVLPGAAVGAYILVHRDWRILMKFEPVRGSLLFLALCAPWFVAVSLRNPEFARFFFWHEHVERFLLPGHGRPGQWWYFVPVLAIGVLPWLGLLVWAAPRWWRADATARFKPTRLLMLWAAIVFLFFSASSSKLPAYILPMFPALALLGASQVDRVPLRTLAGLLAVLAPAVAAVAFLAPALSTHVHTEGFADYLGAFVPWFELGLGVLAVALLAAASVALRGRRSAAIAVAAVGGLAAVTVAMTGYEILSPTYSTEQSFHKVADAMSSAAPDVPFFSVGMYDHSLTFELERPVILVAYRGELDLGLRVEPWKGVPTLEAFRDLWREAPDAFAMMRPSLYAELEGEGLPMRMLTQDPRHVLVRRR